MSLRRIAILLGKELAHTTRSFIFTFAVLVPLVVSLVLSLLLGTLFAGKPRLGIVDEGGSQLTAAMEALDTIRSREYVSVEALRRDVEAGALDIGLVIPAGFDDAIRRGERVEMNVYVWGESLLKHRTVLLVAISEQVFLLAGHEIPVDVVTTTLGEAESIPWAERLLPFVVFLAVIIGGTMIPAVSLVDEKQKRTLRALTITPASLGEVAVAKGIMGGLVSLTMGLVVLALNRAFGAHPALLALVMALSAVGAAELGLLLGLLVPDINTVFTVIKGLGILIYAPAIVYLFPQLPEWVARIFPTYYMLGPIVELSLRGGSWADIAGDVAILCVILVVMLGVLAVVIRRVRWSVA